MESLPTYASGSFIKLIQLTRKHTHPSNISVCGRQLRTHTKTHKTKESRNLFYVWCSLTYPSQEGQASSLGFLCDHFCATSHQCSHSELLPGGGLSFHHWFQWWMCGCSAAASSQSKHPTLLGVLDYSPAVVMGQARPHVVEERNRWMWSMVGSYVGTNRPTYNPCRMNQPHMGSG